MENGLQSVQIYAIPYEQMNNWRTIGVQAQNRVSGHFHEFVCDAKIPKKCSPEIRSNAWYVIWRTLLFQGLARVCLYAFSCFRDLEQFSFIFIESPWFWRPLFFFWSLIGNIVIIRVYKDARFFLYICDAQKKKSKEEQESKAPEKKSAQTKKSEAQKKKSQVSKTKKQEAKKKSKAKKKERAQKNRGKRGSQVQKKKKAQKKKKKAAKKEKVRCGKKKK